jgi:GNAT superfamily N-acetyltransferase
MKATASLPGARPTIALATPADQATVAKVIVAAFEQDPVARWFFASDATYQAAFPPLIAALGGAAFVHGTAYQANRDHGAALWLPPGADPDEAAINELIERTLQGGQRDVGFAIFEQMGHAHPAEPHWYLPLIGVVPLQQGRGIGGALLEASLLRCDEDGLPAYLESTNPRNVPLYKRHGFVVSGEIRAGGCPPLVPMIRPPRT